MDTEEEKRAIPESPKINLKLIEKPAEILKTFDFLVCEIDPKQASKLIKLLNSEKSNFTHLKRIKKLDSGALVCLIGLAYLESTRSFISENNLEKEFIVKVPDCPTTKDQYDQAKLIWPLSLIPIKPRTHSINKTHLNYAISVLKSHSAIVLNESGVLVTTCIESLHPLHHPIITCINQISEMYDTTRPYLCNGYIFYSRTEPCVMCCMALLHSRAKGIFVGSLGNGGLSLMIHDSKMLNHRYFAYQFWEGDLIS